MNNIWIVTSKCVAEQTNWDIEWFVYGETESKINNTVMGIKERVYNKLKSYEIK
jgi:hypothetical protein